MASRNRTHGNTETVITDQQRPTQPEFFMPAMPPLGMLDDLEQWTRRQVRRLRSRRSSQVEKWSN